MLEQRIDNDEKYFTEEEAESIAKENLGLVHYIISTLNIANYNYDDMYDAGLFGYTKAIKSFDKTLNIQFSTYACNCIRNEILCQIQKENKHIVNDISLYKEVMSGDKNKPVIIEDIVEDKNCKLCKVEDSMILDENRKKIVKALSKLDEYEQLVIKHRFGILGCKEMLQKEIAKMLKMSQANVSKLEKSGLEKMKFYMVFINRTETEIKKIF